MATALPIKTLLAALALGLAGPLAASGAIAQDKPAAATSPEEELTPEEKAERESRKACKVTICAAFRARKAGDDIACNVVKTWRKTHLDKMMSKAKVSWPWGPVKCVADIKLKRAELIKAMTDDKHETTLDRHQVVCEVDRDKEGKAEIRFDFTPKIAFEKGKATKATLNWGKIEAPALVKGAMWTATATDNTFNVLQSTVVDDINDFIDKKCDEVKDDWQGK